MILAYLAMIGGTVGLFWLIRWGGRDLAPPGPLLPVPSGPAGPRGSGDALLHVLLALVAIILAARLVGAVFRRLHQPPVIGEVLAGILLGPSLLGRVAPGAYAFVLAPSAAPYLGVISQVGVILYMFLVGLDLDAGLLRGRTRASIAISHASIIAPFLLGSTLALWLYPRLSNGTVSFTVFALFLGVSMSVTAFPVLARILTDRGMQRGPLGTTALACAAVDDVTAWCLLAFVVSVVQAEPGRILLTIGLTAGYIAAMFAVVRPAALRLVRRREEAGRLTQGIFAVVCVALLLSSLATELIGIHALFGAFLLGAIVPHDSGLARDVVARLEDFVVVLLLPAFFAFTGMHTEIGLVHGVEDWLLCGVVILVASAGKFGGGAIAARLTGLPWREAAAIGVLMNTRGLMELIVLNVGLDLGVLSPTLFAMLVVMALATTLATTPLLHWLRVDDRPGPFSAA
jgi:Kef-type K+ transport system membrane component KefB